MPPHHEVRIRHHGAVASELFNAGDVDPPWFAITVDSSPGLAHLRTTVGQTEAEPSGS